MGEVSSRIISLTTGGWGGVGGRRGVERGKERGGIHICCSHPTV
jgi:hypothetical protein